MTTTRNEQSADLTNGTAVKMETEQHVNSADSINCSAGKDQIQPSRICIFVHYNKNNTVAPGIEPYLKGLQSICSEIIFISNSKLPLPDQELLETLVTKVLTRTNQGMDFGAWKTAIDRVGWEHIELFDELVLANDSCYAPLHSFEEMFNAMRDSTGDFWGVTEHRAASVKSGNLRAHLQSYFLVFTRKVVLSSAFRKFWSDVSGNQSNYDSIVKNSEATLTPCLNDAGFKHDVYLKEKSFIGKHQGGNWENPLYFNHTIWSWNNLLAHRSPFLKRRAIPFHLERASRLIHSGYGRKVTKAAYLQTFFWRDCLGKYQSAYPIDIIHTDIQSQVPATLDNPSQRLSRILFHLGGPRRLLLQLKRKLQG